jgi:hypothetical protein
MQRRWPVIVLVCGVMILVPTLSDWLSSGGQEFAALKTVILIVSFLLWLLTTLVMWFDPRLRSGRSRALAVSMLVVTSLLVVLFVLNMLIELSSASQLVEFSTFLWMAGELIWIAVRRLRLRQVKAEAAQTGP